MQSPKKAIISCQKITKSFGPRLILKEVSFKIDQNEKVGLVGPNGSGKSTLLKIISGLVTADEGVISAAKNIEIKYFPQVHDQQNLSGGEAAKRVLIPIIKSSANLYFLDEPTNNLDMNGLTMLEKFVQKSTKSFLIVSHDREFLDRTVTKIIELDEQLKTAITYSGNYSAYYKERTARIERMWKEYSNKTQTVRNYSDSVTEKTKWVKKVERKRSGTRKLSPKEKEKPQAAILRDAEGQVGRQARLIKDRLEKFKNETETTIRPDRKLPPPVVFDISERSGTKVFNLKNVSKIMDKKRIGPINLSIQYGDRILLGGDNGVGKSTLVRMLMQELNPDQGELERGVGLKIGYLSQSKSVLGTESAVEFFTSVANLDISDTRRILNRYGISSEKALKPINKLSPGEYSRLIIAALVAQKPNCIILDEPTNHLDLEVLEALENGLKNFKGALIIVSHDRYFIKRVKLDKEIKL